MPFDVYFSNLIDDVTEGRKRKTLSLLGRSKQMNKWKSKKKTIKLVISLIVYWFYWMAGQFLTLCFVHLSINIRDP